MKLKTLVQEDPKRKIKMIITEAQFMALAKNVVALQEQKQIKNTHLIKTEFKEKIDKDLDNKIRQFLYWMQTPRLEIRSNQKIHITI